MVGPSKILTVSYGTFSCTLEGFDDPFSTMKAIAEYFRDLAADDRYFGAEPPQPDAAMLHRIAEREVQRRVEAKVQDNGVILRAGTAATVPYAPPAAPAAAAPAFATAPVMLPLTAAAPALADASPVLSESVAEKLRRLRAAALAPASPPVVTAAPVAEAAPVVLPAEPEAIVLPVAAEANAGTEVAAADMPRDDAEVAAPAVRAEAMAEPEADGTDEAAETPEAAAARDDEVLTAAVTDEAEADEPAVADEGDAPIAALSDAPDMEAEAASAPPTEGADEDTAIATLAEEPLAEASTAPAEDDVLMDAPAEAEEPQPEEPAADLPGDAEPADGEAAPADPAPTLVLRAEPARARVIKIRRIEARPAAAAEAAAPAVLSPEAEAELARELAELRGDAAPPADPPEAEAAPDLPPLPQTRPALPAADEDAAMRRLLDTADERLAEPESQRRLSAIAHLKAAVAATFADRQNSDSAPRDDEETRRSPYRSDLERVVRPRRPMPGEAAPPSRTARPVAPGAAAPGRPAPLVLVSSQRIDRPAADPANPVRPRRVAALSLAPQAAAEADQTEEEEDDLLAEDPSNVFGEADTGFAEFAERMGATSLPDLLEAAAVYAACVEGRPGVTRPQLIRRVTDLHEELNGGEAPTREDMLRSFGRLLRDGRIEKLRRGFYGVREDSRALAEGKRVAG